MVNNACRNEFQEETLRLSNEITKGRFSKKQMQLHAFSDNELALLLLLVRKARGKISTSNKKRVQERDTDLAQLQTKLFNAIRLL